MSVWLKSAYFEDFDQFREHLVGWDTNLTQVSPGSFKVEWAEVTFADETAISCTKQNLRLVDRMTIDDGYVMFVVCFKPSLSCGIEVPENTLQICSPGRKYLNILPEGYQDFTFFVSIDNLRNYGITMGDKSFDSLGWAQSIICMSSNQLEAFRLLARTVNTLAQQQLAPNDQGLWATVVRERAISLIKSVLQQTNQQWAPTLAGKSSDWLLVARAFDLMDKTYWRYESIAAIGNSLGCSTRLLQQAFQNTLAMTPLQYVLARRLHFARRDLLTAQPSKGNVTDIAAKYEFFHFSRFAHYYKNLYGELPSKTLGKARHIIPQIPDGSIYLTQ